MSVSALLASGFRVEDGVVKEDKKVRGKDGPLQNYEARCRHKQHQVQTSTFGVPSMSSLWLELFTTDAVTIPVKGETIRIFGPDTQFLDNGATRVNHVIYGWLLLRSVVRAALRDATPANNDQPTSWCYLRSDWQEMLDHRGWMAFFGSKPKGGYKQQLANKVQAATKDHRGTNNALKPYADATFMGHHYQCGQKSLPDFPKRILSMIVWEMYEINFRNELRALDR